ncbi:hypothetical protein GDO86_010510 [Hymenochirus boettgeri]|uniref:Uncharacterized protein n=1 Tax=Hymenochirus boettgeri TaxID=247094 RepID=A0A8T2JQS8_9PIPI|nr:hypothetical protein GDO86_010510 [Hymenochirus boettgeri]
MTKAIGKKCLIVFLLFQISEILMAGKLEEQGPPDNYTNSLEYNDHGNNEQPRATGTLHTVVFFIEIIHYNNLIIYSGCFE